MGLIVEGLESQGDCLGLMVTTMAMTRSANDLICWAKLRTGNWTDNSPCVGMRGQNIVTETAKLTEKQCQSRKPYGVLEGLILVCLFIHPGEFHLLSPICIPDTMLCA